MPLPGLRWRFVTINTKNSWHHGSPRGFRARGHRIHSTGDYRKPPPEGEHVGLLRYRLARAEKKVLLPSDVRPRISVALVESLVTWRLKVMSVSSDHAHMLIELPDVPSEIKPIVGGAKRHASREVRDVLPGAIWSAGCDCQAVDDAEHFNACVEYALIKQGAGTWTWSHVDGGMWHEQRVKIWKPK